MTKKSASKPVPAKTKGSTEKRSSQAVALNTAQGTAQPTSSGSGKERPPPTKKK